MNSAADGERISITMEKDLTTARVGSHIEVYDILTLPPFLVSRNLTYQT